MTTASSRLASLLALVLLSGCDDGKAPDAKAAPAAKAEPGKADATKAAPAKTEPAKVEPAPTEPAPAQVEPAQVEPAKVPEPAAVPEPAPTEPVPSEPAVAEPSEPAEPAVAVPPTSAGDGSTPISIGPNAEILKLVLAKDVVNRQPVDPGTSFPSGTKVNLFIESRNESEADIQLTVTWENVANGRRTPPVGVKIPVRKLNRTRAFRTLKLTGQHRAILLDESGKEIAVLPFTIE